MEPRFFSGKEPRFFSRKDSDETETYIADPNSLSDSSVITDGTLKFVAEGGENSSYTAYQEASGAPVESKSPLGYSVGPVTIAFLNLGKMVGTGIFSTPSTVLKGAGSVGLALFYWVIGFLIAASSLSVYLEFASCFPSRSGSEVVYLEQAYPRPKYFFPTVFAIQTVFLSFSSSNAIVLAQYLYKIAGSTPSDWEQKGVAVAGYTVAVAFLVFNTRWSLRFSNAIGLVKLLTLVFISITGLVVLGGHTRVKNPTANFKNAFDGTSGATAYGATNAMYKIVFSYSGYENAFTVVNEVQNPTKLLKRSAPMALLGTSILYMLVNIAYFAASTKAQILASKVTTASLFFENVFGTSGASKALSLLVAISAFGNLIAVLIGQSRVIRECGRQGVLPFASFWTSTRPFGTPLGPYFLKWAVTVLMILAPPAGDAFNFIVDLSTYPMNVFSFALAVGLLVLRWRRKRANLPPAGFRAWDIAVIFSIIANVYLMVMPWYPPATGRYGGNVSFWYATYCVVGIAILAVCAIYYYFWIHLLPKFGHYQIRQKVVELEGGVVTHTLVRVPDGELEAWDASHDVTGRALTHRRAHVEGEKDGFA
ncbi:high affinity methionine permease [Venturia nashicola]|uniref:High affinity methionine permease n=1 Tax=Venturia nashicola TaxID=86259 RepID=A0A4Z1NZT1_9PEZI|nr:high affinity methionine permease [Venturia nashicola]